MLRRLTCVTAEARPPRSLIVFFCAIIFASAGAVEWNDIAVWLLLLLRGDCFAVSSDFFLLLVVEQIDGPVAERALQPMEHAYDTTQKGQVRYSWALANQAPTRKTVHRFLNCLLFYSFGGVI
jgi:hypothetical protein